jgi:hypothetical protein
MTRSHDPFRSLSRRAVPLAALVLVLAGCAQMAPAPSPAPAPSAPARAPAAPLPSHAEPPPPKINLSGFPLPYRQGYADGCASATGPERKDGDRFYNDGNYRTGWMDGSALCRK